MWGTRGPRRCEASRRRFIPTHVGNTDDGGSWWEVPAVHPHACGEHAPFARSSFEGFGSSPRMWEHCASRKERPWGGGSSPRMWGTLRQGWRSGSRGRFIPTHVGNTFGPVAHVPGRPVHPHACGEHPGACVSVSVKFGSSPRMWGTLSQNASVWLW